MSEKNPTLYDLFPWVHAGKFDCDGAAVWFTEAMDGKTVGIVAAEERGPGVWYFFGGAVDPEYRQQGIWRKLHEARTQYVIANGAKILFGISAPGNRKAYEAEGWEPITTYPYHEDFDEVVYFKCLEANDG